MCVIGLARDQGRQQRGQVHRVHLPVCGHHGGEVCPERERVPATRRDRRAHSLIACMLDQDDGPRERPDDLGGGVETRIVDHDDVIHEARNAVERSRDQLRFIVRRHHDGDSSICKHRLVLEGHWTSPGLADT